MEANEEKDKNFYHFQIQNIIGKIKKIYGKHWVTNLRVFGLWFASYSIMNMDRKIKINLICISLIPLMYLFLFPIPHLFGYSPLSFLIGYQNKIIFSEPAIMFLLGSGLIGIGIIAEKKFKKNS
jgi:hypothetical protein